MLYSTSLGFNPVSALKTAGKAVYNVARDPNVQRAAMAAGQAYAPQQYAQAATYADRARGLVQQIRPPGPPQMMPQGPMPPQMPMPPMDDEPPARMAPIQKGNLLPMLLLGGGVVVLVLLLKR